MVNLMEVSCDPACGFNIRSHDKKELTKFVQLHAKNAHKMEITAKDVEAKMVAA
jgi:predicted small metal-binding protein